MKQIDERRRVSIPNVDMETMINPETLLRAKANKNSFHSNRSQASNSGEKVNSCFNFDYKPVQQPDQFNNKDRERLIYQSKYNEVLRKNKAIPEVGTSYQQMRKQHDPGLNVEQLEKLLMGK